MDRLGVTLLEELTNVVTVTRIIAVTCARREQTRQQCSVRPMYAQLHCVQKFILFGKKMFGCKYPLFIVLCMFYVIYLMHD
jgi:hypothetical protein